MAGTVIWLVSLAIGVHAIPLSKHEECGYQNCPKTNPDVLNVHIVAHTHDDVGWLKTVDQYYYGSRNNIQKAGVQYILDSVIKELWEDPKRKFIYVETAFFWKWWVRQPSAIQDQVRTLVAESRLQFVGGAWSMNDEAAVHYQSTVDQFTWGLSKINETFGPCALPRVGWQIDPFGHAREFASLLAGMGYDGLFLGRIDYQDKRARLSGRTMEMLWRGDDDLGKPSDIFTGVLYNTYSPPPGFCFDVLCNDEPIIDDITSPMYNVDEKVRRFVNICEKMADSYLSNNILVTMGDDFQYMDAGMWYKNLDKLIKYTNLKAAKEHLNIKLFYSTPNCYLKAVKDANPTLPVKQDDFFPYASDGHSYWTGYFTSRPTTKYFERQGNDYLQMAKQLQLLAGLERHNQFMLNSLKSAMGVMQHHDAITGTEKQHVTHDYERLLDDAIDDSLVIPRQAFNKVMQGDATLPPLFTFDRCRLNESSCHASEHNNRVVVTLYNPVAWGVNEAVRVPVREGNYEVYAPNGDKIDSQLVDIPKQVIDIPTRESDATHEIVFIAHLKPLMYKSFYVQKLTKTKRDVKFIQPNKRLADTYADNNEYFKVKTINDIKNIENVQDKDIDVKIPLEPTKLQQADIEAIDLNVLKDKDMPLDEKVQELDRLIKEAREMSVRQRESVMKYYNLNEEEIRMLSDEPYVVDKLDDYYVMENEKIKLHVDNTSGEIKRAIFPNGDSKLMISFHYYTGSVGDNEEAANRSSGAYIFRPTNVQPIAIKAEDTNTVQGKVVDEIRLSYPNNVFSTLRLYKDFDFVEVEWLVGPIDINDGIGKEYVIKYATDLVTNGEFYTDSNGRQSLKRKLNKRPQYNVTLAEPVGGNYYPVVNEIYIEENDKRLTVMTDRSQGGTSLIEGEVELMLHRRLLHDDAFGVGEALNETAAGKGLVVRGTHRLMISTGDHTKEKINIVQMHLRPVVFISDAENLSLEDWLKLKNCHSWLKNKLPEGIHLLTLEPWGNKLLLRLENLLDTSDVSIEVDLNNILNNINIKSVKETMLSANEKSKKWEWKTEKEFSESFNKEYGSFDGVKSAVNEDRVNDDKVNEDTVNEDTVNQDRVNEDTGNEDTVNEDRVKKDRVNEDRVVDNGFKIMIKAKEIRTFIVDYEFVG